jgi:hypothetical protein
MHEVEGAAGDRTKFLPEQNNFFFSKIKNKKNQRKISGGIGERNDRINQGNI